MRVEVDWRNGLLRGTEVSETHRTLGDLKGIFADQTSLQGMDPARVIYRVQSFTPVPDGREGGLFWGTTVIEPGRVGDEYFMTKGHFHACRDRGEYYVTVSGRGALILMSEDRRTWVEEMRPGSLHYIPGHTAHRVANTGELLLSFVACWPSDAGHDYETIASFGFGARLLDRAGVPSLIPSGPEGT